MLEVIPNPVITTRLSSFPIWLLNLFVPFDLKYFNFIANAFRAHYLKKQKMVHIVNAPRIMLRIDEGLQTLAARALRA